jgi:hypothetical protein
MEYKNYDIETKLSYITKLDSDVVRVEVRKDIEAELEDLEENYKAYQSLFTHKKLYFLVVFNKGANTSLEVRNKFASKQRSSFKIAEAIVVESMSHKLIANFVLKVQKPTHRMQVFNNEPDALNWLLKVRLNNNKK